MIDFFYCERTSFGILGEPLNSITNLSFIAAAIILFLKKEIKNKIFSIIIFLIGIGSLLFHSYMNSFTAFLDVFFIAVFIYYFLLSLYLKLNIPSTLSYILPIFFLMICYFFGSVYSESFLKTSSFYIPILFHLIILYLYFLNYKNKNYYSNYFFKITLIFTFSLFLRTLDKYSCYLIPIGTHFIWHILNSLFLYHLVKFYHLIAYRTSPKKPT